MRLLCPDRLAPVPANQTITLILKTIANITWGYVEGAGGSSSSVMSMNILDMESSHLLDKESRSFLDFG